MKVRIQRLDITLLLFILTIGDHAAGGKQAYRGQGGGGGLRLQEEEA
jgi:hypothetical protein